MRRVDWQSDTSGLVPFLFLLFALPPPPTPHPPPPLRLFFLVLNVLEVKLHFLILSAWHWTELQIYRLYLLQNVSFSTSSFTSWFVHARVFSLAAVKESKDSGSCAYQCRCKTCISKVLYESNHISTKPAIVCLSMHNFEGSVLGASDQDFSKCWHQLPWSSGWLPGFYRPKGTELGQLSDSGSSTSVCYTAFLPFLACFSI